jgi:hypothetical protein
LLKLQASAAEIEFMLDPKEVDSAVWITQDQIKSLLVKDIDQELEGLLNCFHFKFEKRCSSWSYFKK